MNQNKKIKTALISVFHKDGLDKILKLLNDNGVRFLSTGGTQAFIKDMNLYHGKAPFVHSHNFFLEVWIEAGLLGIVGFISSMLWNIKRAAHTVRHCGDSAARTITCAACAAMCGSLVCGLADYLWNYPRVMCMFWFVFAMALAGVKICRMEAGT